MKTVKIPLKALYCNKLGAQEFRLLIFLTNIKVKFFNMTSFSKKAIAKNNNSRALKKEFSVLLKNDLVNRDGSGLSLKPQDFIEIPENRILDIKNNKRLFIASLDCRGENMPCFSFKEMVSIFGYDRESDIRKNLKQLRKNMQVNFDFKVGNVYRGFTFYNIQIDNTKL